MTIARELIAKSPMVLAYTKHAIRAVRGMDMDQAYEYLGAKTWRCAPPIPNTRENAACAQSWTRKSYRPGLEPLKRPSSEK